MSVQPTHYFSSEHQRSYVPHFWGARTSSEQSQATVLPYDDTAGHNQDYDSPPGDSASPPTVIPYAPSPPEITHNPPELYGPARLFGPPLVAAYQSTKAPLATRPPLARPSASNPAVHFDEAQLAMDTAASFARGRSIRDELTIAAGTVTPGVDDTPYIQYALDALTREGGAVYARSTPSGCTDEGEYPGSLVTADPELGFLPSLGPPPPAHPRDSFRLESIRRQSTSPEPPTETPVETPTQQQRILAARDSLSPSFTSDDSGNAPKSHKPRTFDRTKWLAVDDSFLSDRRVDPLRKVYPHLTYKPRILRPASMIALTTLCVLMITGLMFSAIYSNHHAGFISYGGTILNGQYFLFRILPQTVAAVILFYAQAIITTCFRLLPFALMADQDPRVRHGALFQDLYPKSFLWPHLVGPWQIKLCIFVTWLMNFTLPLQSAAFTVIYVNDSWIWTAVLPVVWTLVPLYFCLIGSTIMMMLFWHRRTTGVMWDIRSIADIIPMLNRTNTMTEYHGTDVLGKRKELRVLLRNRLIDRLGYWKVQDPTIGIWYGIGVEWAQVNMPPSEYYRLTGKLKNKNESISTFNTNQNASDIRYRYLPWCMRNNQLIYFVVSGGVLLTALFVASFVEGTRLSRGFLPELSALPGPGAFSPANFLYSFLPSLLGQVLFLLFQALDQSIRIYHPWAQLANPRGAIATESILLDYAACLPFQSAWQAFRNRNYRVAFISLLAALFIFLPILAGGLFMALTVANTGEVRMFPNVPVFGVLLGLLVLFVIGLIMLLPDRGKYRLPHAVTCLAEIISFCSSEELTSDAAFRFPRSKWDLLTRLTVGREKHDQALWHFGHTRGRGETFGVRKLQRYTERRVQSHRAEGVLNEKRAPRPIV